MAAVKTLDSRALEDSLKRAATALGALGIAATRRRPAGADHRRFVARRQHHRGARAFRQRGDSHLPRPRGEAVRRSGECARRWWSRHRPGNCMNWARCWSAAAAANLGWHVTYLGASLPAAEIAGAAQAKPGAGRRLEPGLSRRRPAAGGRTDAAARIVAARGHAARGRPRDAGLSRRAREDRRGKNRGPCEPMLDPR